MISGVPPFRLDCTVAVWLFDAATENLGIAHVRGRSSRATYSPSLMALRFG